MKFHTQPYHRGWEKWAGGGFDPCHTVGDEKATKPPARSNIVVLQQLLKHIPRSLIGGGSATDQGGVQSGVRSWNTAGEHDNKRAREVCASIEAGEIVVFDKAYVGFDHLADLDQRGVWCQVYSALLVYVLLRFQAHLSNWGHSFTRFFAVVRAALWERIDLLLLLKSYGQPH